MVFTFLNGARSGRGGGRHKRRVFHCSQKLHTIQISGSIEYHWDTATLTASPLVALALQPYGSQNLKYVLVGPRQVCHSLTKICPLDNFTKAVAHAVKGKNLNPGLPRFTATWIVSHHTPQPWKHTIGLLEVGHTGHVCHVCNVNSTKGSGVQSPTNYCIVTSQAWPPALTAPLILSLTLGSQVLGHCRSMSAGVVRRTPSVCTTPLPLSCAAPCVSSKQWDFLSSGLSGLNKISMLPTLVPLSLSLGHYFSVWKMMRPFCSDAPGWWYSTRLILAQCLALHAVIQVYREVAPWFLWKRSHQVRLEAWGRFSWVRNRDETGDCQRSIFNSLHSQLWRRIRVQAPGDRMEMRHQRGLFIKLSTEW